MTLDEKLDSLKKKYARLFEEYHQTSDTDLKRILYGRMIKIDHTIKFIEAHKR